MNDVWSHYLTAHVWITLPDGIVHVQPAAAGSTSGPFPGDVVHILTAWNPLGHVADRASNTTAQQRLAADLLRSDLTTYPAVGGDADRVHTEDSVAVIDLDRHRALALGRRYRQHAIFEWTSTEWSALACSSPSPHSTGWHSTRQ